jgi:hypothetical protein
MARRKKIKTDLAHSYTVEKNVSQAISPQEV